MLTPQDVQNKEFPKAVFGGYDMASVDDFLEVLTADFAALFKENAILKSKIKVLVEKVEEYRSTEDSMRMALLTAQKMGDDLVEEATKKSEKMLADAEHMLEIRKAETAKCMADEEYRLEAAKKANAEFVEKSMLILKAHTEFLNSLASVQAPEKALEPEIPETPAEPAAEDSEVTAAQIEEALAKLDFQFGEEDLNTEKANAEIDLQNLQFDFDGGNGK